MRAAANLPPVATDVDGEAGLRRQLRPAPGDHVVLQRASAAVIDDGAVLERDAAAIGEERLVVRAQLIGAPVDVAVAGGLVHVPVRLEGCEDRFHVAGRQRSLILADHVGLVNVEGGLEQRRAVLVAAGQRPGAEVQPQLDDALVLLLVVAGERKGKTDASAVAVDPARLPAADTALAPNQVLDLEFRRPAYLPTLAGLLVVFVAASSALALVSQPIDGLLLGVGGLILAIWGVRSVLVPSSLEAVTAVDLALSGVILLLLIGVAMRAALHLHRRAGLHLPRLRQRP
jgi:hypothetical protein